MYQKLIIVGNLGNDPELRSTEAGQAVTNFSVATARRWTGADGQRREETTWFRVAAWGKTAEACAQYLRKGKQVLVEGRLTIDKETGAPRLWTDQEGNPRATFEVTATEVKFLGSASVGTAEGDAKSAGPEGKIDF